MLRVAGACLLILTAGLRSSDVADASRFADASERGLEFLAAAWQGDAYDDAYLAYVYPDERLACPLPDCRLTYRLLDAYINLSFIEQAGVAPGPAEPQIRRARDVLAALALVWRDEGLYNVSRAPEADGIALDTYCMVGLLQHDQAMAGVVASRLDGDGWIPDDFYDPLQGYRKFADETWCVGLLAATDGDPVRVDRLVRASIARARGQLREPTGIEIRTAVALHAAYVLMQVDDRRFEADLTFFLEQLQNEARHPGLEHDVLMQANILEALARSRRVPPARLRAIAKGLVDRQEPDGGWHSRVGERGSALRVFTSLRAVLALRRYADLVAAEAGRGD